MSFIYRLLISLAYPLRGHSSHVSHRHQPARLKLALIKVYIKGFRDFAVNKAGLSIMLLSNSMLCGCLHVFLNYIPGISSP